MRWFDKRFHTWNYHLKQTFGEKIFKVMLDGGFTCPNRDGKVATGGCTFCSARGSGDFAGWRRDEIAKQFADVKKRQHLKWPHAKYIAYFQAYTNTYAPVDVLRDLYDTALAQEGVVGMSIATRPDCLPEDVVELLAEYHQKTYLWVELGLQTSNDQTSVLINRGHDFHCYVDGVDKLRQKGIRVCCHIIYGLPGEDETMMLQTAKDVSQLNIQGLKIHLLHLLKKTPMVKQYEAGLLQFLDQETYVRLVVDTLEIMPPQMIMHRVTGDGPKDLLIGPMWSDNKWEVLNAIDRELERRDTWQGKFFEAQQMVFK